MKPYYQILHELRIKQNLSQKQVAEILKISQNRYSRYERGINQMPLRHLATLCRFYGVSADFVLGLEKE